MAEFDLEPDPGDVINVVKWVDKRVKKVEETHTCVLMDVNNGKHTRITATENVHERLKRQHSDWKLTVILKCEKEVAEQIETAVRSQNIRGPVSKGQALEAIAHREGYDIYGSFDPIVKVQNADRMLERIPY